MTTSLQFKQGNAKLPKTVGIFDLPAGFTCPGALDCLSRANRITGKITDGKDTKFRCYAASMEAVFKATRAMRWRNFEAIKAAKTIQGMADLILSSIPKNAIRVRMHSSGDFFSQDYFDAWVLAAKARPELIFYGYTKALYFWITRKAELPGNFRLVASVGGRFDNLISKYGLRSARVVFTEAEAKDLKLRIEHGYDDCVWDYDQDFALVLHGTQPKGSEAGKAWQKNKFEGWGYSVEKRELVTA